MRWYEQQRMAWISEAVDIFGFVNREHIIKKFDVSMPQASHDLKVWQKLNPNKISYDVSKKRYQKHE
jgi:hypothetical protein